MWPSVRVFATVRSRRTTLVLLGALTLALIGITLFIGRHAPWLADPTSLRTWVSGFGPLAPAAFVVLQAAQVLIAPIPGHALGLVSGYLIQRENPVDHDRRESCLFD